MTLLRPATPEEAARLFAEHPDALPLAGGTDIMVLWNMGLLNDRAVLDLSKLTPWRGIKEGKASLTLGALASHAELRDHAAVARHFPLLAQACAVVGGEQIQNRGTIGGNIANASPAGDTFPALAVYDAVCHMTAHTFKRSLPILKVFAGVKKTHLKPGELIASVELPFPAKPARQMFRKVGTRAAQAISKVVAAGLLWLNRDGTVKELRFALGSVAPTVKRLSAAEEFLRGKKLTHEVIAAAAALVEKDASPIDDIRSTRQYRLAVCRALLADFLKS